MAIAFDPTECRKCGGTGTVSVYVGGMGGAIRCPRCTRPDDFDQPALGGDA